MAGELRGADGDALGVDGVGYAEGAVGPGGARAPGGEEDAPQVAGAGRGIGEETRGYVRHWT